MSDKCEMCGESTGDGGSGRLHDTYDCAVSLRAQLRAYEGSLPLDEQRELQVLLRQQGNELEELRSEVARLTAERDRFHDDYWSRVGEVERLARELEECEAKRVASARLNCDLVAQNAKLIERNRGLGDTVAPWTVEYLEKEKADG